MTGAQARAVGRLIAKARARAGLSFAELEAVSGLPATWLFRVEKGHYESAAPDRIGRLADALDIDPAEINRVSGDYLATGLAERRIYLRGKEKLPLEALDEADRFFEQLRRKYEAQTETDGAQP